MSVPFCFLARICSSMAFCRMERENYSPLGMPARDHCTLLTCSRYLFLPSSVLTTCLCTRLALLANELAISCCKEGTKRGTWILKSHNKNHLPQCYYWGNCSNQSHAQGLQAQLVLFSLTASISSSSSSMVDTVTVLYFPTSRVCLVIMIWKQTHNIN